MRLGGIVSFGNAEVSSVAEVVGIEELVGVAGEGEVDSVEAVLLEVDELDGLAADAGESDDSFVELHHGLLSNGLIG